MNVGLIKTGFNLFTGEPGLNRDDRDVVPGTVIHQGKYVYSGGNADQYRNGIIYMGIGPFRTGVNAEMIRHSIQNISSHDFLMKGKAHHFQVLDRTPKTYWYFGSGYGSGLY